MSWKMPAWYLIRCCLTYPKNTYRFWKQMNEPFFLNLKWMYALENLKILKANIYSHIFISILSVLMKESLVLKHVESTIFYSHTSGKIFFLLLYHNYIYSRIESYRKYLIFNWWVWSVVSGQWGVGEGK